MEILNSFDGTPNLQRVVLLDDLKFAIVMNGIKNHSTLPKYLDELVSENNLDEEEQEILHTLFKEVHDYFNAD